MTLPKKFWKNSSNDNYVFNQSNADSITCMIFNEGKFLTQEIIPFFPFNE